MINTLSTFCVPSLNILLFGDNTNNHYNKLIVQAVQKYIADSKRFLSEKGASLSLSLSLCLSLSLSLSHVCFCLSLVTSALIINVVYAIILLLLYNVVFETLL